MSKKKKTFITQQDLLDAFHMMQSFGFAVYVPGCFDISTDEDALLYAISQDAFYSKVDPKRFFEMHEVLRHDPEGANDEARNA